MKKKLPRNIDAAGMTAFVVRMPKAGYDTIEEAGKAVQELALHAPVRED